MIEAYRMVKRYNDCILVPAGSPATDDPEGTEVLELVKDYASSEPDIHILLLPPFGDQDFKALERMATGVLQKSLKEGFGLTVSEAMSKKKPVIGGAVGGIPLQIIHGVNGFLANPVEGTAFRIRQLLNQPGLARTMKERGKESVRKNLLITLIARQAGDYLAAWYASDNKGTNVFEL